ncbi:pilus assembly protein TadG-related protein [Caenibius sp. WL]|uniref:VWA domain-containing protein n=1 Tax=Caenibius sp. WL TaxID=2872646 RepID=UPI001C99ABBE|nr:pilus assembly protein TadG-related protein [Caenibius sp. WL]QZP07756.1 VWA domain-containing protein [Caenibius sp. WL]
MNRAAGFSSGCANVRRCAANLLRHEAGNTLAVVAFAVLMLLAAVGGGVDMSRAYMVKTNLQSACDAGVLAGRKALSRTGDYGSAEQEKADKMFAFNFRKSAAQSHDVTFTSEAHEDGSVTGTATATMPTTIMAVFKFSDMDLRAECSAELQMASADVMFVLDVTGSMAGTKIQGLRDAVRDFHTTVARAVIDKDRTVIRYGFVPYSMTVNASGLVASGALPTGAFADNTPYQTRVAYFNTVHYLPNEGTAVRGKEELAPSVSKSECNDWIASTSEGGGPAPKDRTKTTYVKGQDWSKTGTRGSGKNKVDIGTCYRIPMVTTTTYTTVYKFTQWLYKQTMIDTTGVVPGGRSLITSLSSNDNYYVAERGEYDMRALAKLHGTANTNLPAPTTYAWNGCIEERQTVVDLAMNPVPDGALDLDINSAPIADNDNTKWKPYWGIVEYNRSGTRATERCPAPMRQFQEVDTRTPDTVPEWLDTYLNSLTAVGNTYHDIGMIWGARLASTRGMFAANVLEGNRTSVSRHIIFMTDGQMEPSSSGYNAYGIEDLDRRIAPSGSGSGANSTLATYHTNRFLAACRAAREEGYTIWVISFGTSITNAMRTCASADRAYQATNTTELRNAFRYIAGQVADLRLKR